MSWEQPETRRSRAAVVLLVVAIFVATALAIALVVGVADNSEGVIVGGIHVTRGTVTEHGAPRRPRPTPSTTRVREVVPAGARVVPGL